jgi:lactoylglutathione lyase
MKFLWCSIHVRDLEKSLRFYQEIVGLNVLNRFGAAPGPQFVFLDGEGSQVELICDGRETPPALGADISLGFEVQSLDEKMAFVREKGVPVESGPFQPNPHVRFFFVKDPDGLSIQFVENS